jgi:hypothetical protein
MTLMTRVPTLDEYWQQLGASSAALLAGGAAGRACAIPGSRKGSASL